MSSGAVIPPRADGRAWRSVGVAKTEDACGYRRGGSFLDEAKVRPFEAVAWIVVPLAGLSWVLAHLSGTYYFYDEWSMIGRVVGSTNALSASFESFNGHLIFVTFWLYWVQLHLFGLGDHTLVYLVFALSLVAMHVTLALLLRTVRVPAIVALLGAGIVVYFGVGSQSMVFEFQLSWNLAYTSGFAAALIALRCRPTGPAAGALTGILLCGLLCDSAIATLGIVLVVVVLFCGWPRRTAIAAVALPVMAAAWWSAVVGRDLGGRESLAQEAAVAWRLIAAAAAGFGGRHGPGLTVTALSLALVIGGLLRRSFDRRTISFTSAATVTLVAGILLVTVTRAKIIGDDVVDVNRYVQMVGIYLLLVILPPGWRIVSPRLSRYSAQPVVIVALSAMFVVNLGPLNSYRREFDAWNVQTRALVGQSAAVIARGCGPSRTLNLAAQPLTRLGPQISVSLLQHLLANGDLAVPSSLRGRARQPGLSADICVNR